MLSSVQFSSVQFSFISAPPHEQNNKMLKSLCVVKDGLEKGRYFIYDVKCLMLIFFLVNNQFYVPKT